MLGAVDDRGITGLGRTMARLPVHPRIARLMVEGAHSGYSREAALVGAMLSERDVFERWVTSRPRGRDHLSAARLARRVSDSDVLDRLAALQSFERSGQTDFAIGRLNAGAARFVLRARDQLLRLMEIEGGGPLDSTERNMLDSSDSTSKADEALLRAVAVAYLDRLARRREPNSRRGLMVGKRGVRFLDSSAVTCADLFVCVDLVETGDSEANVRIASVVEQDWLPPDILNATTEIEFDALRERVVAIRRTRMADLVINEAATSIPSEDEASGLLASEAAAQLDLRNLIDDGARQFLNRVEFLADSMPELNLPRWNAELLKELLPELCRGCRSFAELRRASVVEILKSKLSGSQLAAVSCEAPERITVPSGSEIALDYQPGKTPVLAVRIQEVFGLHSTPRIAGGRVPILLHLLAPNFRPQQVTSDLASFWRTTYDQVRKELRRRYPKHAWPDDPLAAKPERSPRRKK